MSGIYIEDAEIKAMADKITAAVTQYCIEDIGTKEYALDVEKYRGMDTYVVDIYHTFVYDIRESDVSEVFHAGMGLIDLQKVLVDVCAKFDLKVPSDITDLQGHWTYDEFRDELKDLVFRIYDEGEFSDLTDDMSYEERVGYCREVVDDWVDMFQRQIRNQREYDDAKDIICDVAKRYFDNLDKKDIAEDIETMYSDDTMESE